MFARHLPFAIAFLFGGPSAFTQDTLAQSHRWSISVGFAPEVAYRMLHAGNDDRSSAAFISRYHGADGGRFGWRAELMMGYALNDHWIVSAGLAYAIMGFRSNLYTEQLIYGNWLDPYAGVLFTTSTIPPERIESIKSFEYLEVPLELRASWGKRRVKPLVRIEHQQASCRR